MTAFDEQHSLWTYDERPAWTDRNCGIADRLLTNGLSLAAATSGANHLADIYAGDTFEVRDIHDTTVHVAGPERTRPDRAARAPKPRRKLGSRS